MEWKCCVYVSNFCKDIKCSTYFRYLFGKHDMVVAQSLKRVNSPELLFMHIFHNFFSHQKMPQDNLFSILELKFSNAFITSCVGVSINFLSSQFFTSLIIPWRIVIIYWNFTWFLFLRHECSSTSFITSFILVLASFPLLSLKGSF